MTIKLSELEAEITEAFGLLSRSLTDAQPTMHLAAHALAIVAAAPVLLAISKAALEFHRGTCDHPEDRCRGDAHQRGCPVFSADRRLREALDEVEP